MSGIKRKLGRKNSGKGDVVILGHWYADIVLVGNKWQEHLTFVIDISTREPSKSQFMYELDGSDKVQALQEITDKLMEHLGIPRRREG